MGQRKPRREDVVVVAADRDDLVAAHRDLEAAGRLAEGTGAVVDGLGVSHRCASVPLSGGRPTGQRASGSRRGRPMETKTCAGHSIRSLVVACSRRVARRAPFRRAPARPATPSTASTATSSPTKALEGRRGAQRDRRPEDQPVAARRRSKRRPQLLEVDLRLARRGRLPGPGAVRVRRQGGLEAQEEPLDRRQVREPAPAAGAAARHARTRRRCSASTTTGSSSPNAALDMLDDAGGAQSPAPASPGGASRASRATTTGTAPTPSTTSCSTAASARCGCCIDAPCWAQPNPGACEAGDSQLHPAPQHYDEFAEFAVDRGQALPGVGRHRGLERAQLPALLGRPARARRLREDAQDGRRRRCTSRCPG